VSGSTLSIGAALAYTSVAERTVRAAIIASNVATGALQVRARANDTFLTVAAGQANADEVGVAASVAFNQTKSTTLAAIDAATIAAAAVLVQAQQATHALSLTGARAGTETLTVGAAAAAMLLEYAVEAAITRSAVTSAGDVTVRALSDEVLAAEAAGAGVSGDITIAGSATLLQLKPQTSAHIDGGTTGADGQIVIEAARTADITTAAGASALGFQLGFGELPQEVHVQFASVFMHCGLPFRSGTGGSAWLSRSPHARSPFRRHGECI
jgi:hypothetical protein